MKKIFKMIALGCLLCCCFWICSCGATDNSSSLGGSSVESSQETSSGDTSVGDSASDYVEDSENGGNWTDEMPFNS